MKYHLLKDFGVYKQSIKNNYYSGDLGQSEYPEVGELLERRTQFYTLDELGELFGFLWTSHDECVNENAHDYLSIQVYNAVQKLRVGKQALEKLKKLKGT